MSKAHLLPPLLLVRPDRNDEDAAALAAVGVPTLVDPYLATAPVEDPASAGALLLVLGSQRTGDWLVLTSPRAIPAWRALVGAQVLDAALAGALAAGVRVAAVGRTSAASLPVDPADVLLPPIASAASLAERLLAGPAGRAVLPGSRIASPELADALRGAGWQVATGAVYDTAPVADRPPSADLVEAGGLCGILLRSPSAVRAVAAHARVPATVPVLAVGPSTHREATGRPWRVIGLPPGSPPETAAAARSVLTQGAA